MEGNSNPPLLTYKIYTMATLLEFTNELDAIQKKFEAEVLQNQQKQAALKLESDRLHKGVHRKMTALQKVIQKATEANDKLG